MRLLKLRFGRESVVRLIARNANFENLTVDDNEMSRTDARWSNFKGVNFKDTNAYSTRFDGSNLENANFENVILSGASFGKYNGEGQI